MADKEFTTDIILTAAEVRGGEFMTEKEARDIAYKELNYDENGNLYDREPRQILECVRKDENSYTFTYTIPDYDDFVNTIFVDTKYGDAYPSPL